MSLRMSICAVISLGLALGAHWVSGQAAQGPPSSSAEPPRVSGGESRSGSGAAGSGPGEAVPPPSLAGGPSGNAPPRLAIPNTRAPAVGAQSGAEPGDAPPRIASPAGDSPPPPGVDDLPGLPPVGPRGGPPALADSPTPPPTAPPHDALDSPGDDPPMIASGDPDPGLAHPGGPTDSPPPISAGDLPDLLDDPLGDLAGDLPSIGSPDLGSATADADVPVGAPGPKARLQDPADDPPAAPMLPDPGPAFPADPDPMAGAPDPYADVDGVDAGAPAQGMAVSSGGMQFPLAADPLSPPAAQEPPDDGPLAVQEMPDDPGLGGGDPFPGLGGGQPDPSPLNEADLAAEPAESGPGSPAPGLPTRDPNSFSNFGASGAAEAAPAMPRPAPDSPDFASAGPASASAPPEDPSIRASAAPFDGTGAMADSLADRLPEGPRDVQLNLDVSIPPTTIINVPMQAVVTLRNEGRDDAFDVYVRLPLPDGLEHQESSPPAETMEDDGRTLVWHWSSLPSGDSRAIDLRVKPLKAVPMDLVPRVSSVMAAKSRTAVQEPKLKIDLVGPNGEVLKGTNFDFSVTVRNVGNGPARGVDLIATLSGGLQGYDDAGSLNDATRFELEVGDLSPGEVRGPYALSVRADSQGPHSCAIKAESPDVVPETPVAIKEVTIVAPKLALDVAGPDSRPVGSVADYVVTIRNEGTAAATDVAVALFAPESGEPTVPADAKYRQDPEKRLHSIYWRVPRLDKGESRQFRVPITLERIAIYTVEVAAHCDGFREPRDTPRDQQPTDVMGIADVKIVGLDRKDTVIDAGGTTEFEIRIRNDGSKEATNVKVDFFTNEWISVVKTDPADAATNPDNPVQHGFAAIDRLAPGVERTFIVEVKAQKAPPSGQAVANFDVKVYWDDLPESAAVSSNSHVRIAEGQVARTPSTPPR
ncbi:DUF11 domain-containing protein [Tautonia plasticadhaerens]|uniref:Large cysteine-rich periplasmic protein OmcB n=1 Tax=Tautonia plasticadhaerens TaxID=2527974 RepID=A0A518HA62_9BACT|nr:DUF11 domain-containing protein [Tautonia plasticadhaerens]QDV37740.1 Large cysteine-rich periplasmic protein OmcB precursor [Tautonia plasticadhaerens]